MENRKDRNVFDVMNDVDVNVETMDMSDEEKDACVKRLRRKIKTGGNGRSHGWKTAVAAVAAILVLSGGGLTYAAETGSLAWFFDSLSKETGSDIPEKYVDKSYINNEYDSNVNVKTESDARVSFDLKKAAVDGDQVNIAMIVTYDDFDTDKYDHFEAKMMIMDDNENVTSSFSGSTALGDGIALTDKQTMSDILYKLNRKNAYKVGDIITMECDSIILFGRADTEDGQKNCEEEQVYGPWTLQFRIQENLHGRSVDVSDMAGIDKCTINAKSITMDITEPAVADSDSLEPVVLEMTDNKKLKNVIYGISTTGGDEEIQSVEMAFTKPIDISQVRAVWMGGKRYNVN